jgi:hypothetical protein
MPILKILGRELLTPEPYASGHVCSAAEAATLNAALTRGLAKGLYRELSENGEASKEQLKSFIQGYLRGFSEGHERLRAIEAEARRLGRARVEAALYRSGRKLADLAKGEQELAISREAEKSELLAEATRRIDTLRAIGKENLEELAEGEI